MTNFAPTTAQHGKVFNQKASQCSGQNVHLACRNWGKNYCPVPFLHALCTVTQTKIDFQSTFSKQVTLSAGKMPNEPVHQEFKDDTKRKLTAHQRLRIDGDNDILAGLSCLEGQLACLSRIVVLTIRLSATSTSAVSASGQENTEDKRCMKNSASSEGCCKPKTNTPSFRC